MRRHIWKTLFDPTGTIGKPLNNATISIYEAGTTTPVFVFTSETGTTAVSATPQLTTNDEGFFECWIAGSNETYGYNGQKKFKIVEYHDNMGTKTYDNIDVFKLSEGYSLDTNTTKNKMYSNYDAKNMESHRKNTDPTVHGISGVTTTSTDTTKNKLVSNNLIKRYYDTIGSWQTAFASGARYYTENIESWSTSGNTASKYIEHSLNNEYPLVDLFSTISNEKIIPNDMISQDQYGMTIYADQNSLPSGGMPLFSQDLNHSSVIYGNDFTRVSSGYCFNPELSASGLLESSHNTPRFEVNDRNMIPINAREDLSDDFWTLYNITRETNVTGISDPNGTFNFDRIEEDVTGSSVSHGFYNNNLTGLTDDGVYVFSGYFRVGYRRSIALRIDDKDGSYGIVYFDLFNGTKSYESGATGKIEYIDNFTYRCSISMDISSGGTTPAITAYLTDGTENGDILYTGDGFSDAYVWGLSFERAIGDSTTIGPSDYYRLETKKLLMEPKATNLLLAGYGEGAKLWTASEASVSANAATGPDGESTADKIIASTNNTFHYVTHTPATLSDNTDYIFWIDVKAAGYDWIRLRLPEKDGTYGSVYYGLTAGVVGTESAGFEGSIYPMPGGWFRIVIKWNSQSGATATDIRIYAATGDTVSSFAGDGTSGFCIAHCQLEEYKGSPTSRIPTYNHLGHSEDLTDADWTAANLTPTLDTTYDAPDAVAGAAVHKLTATNDGAPTTHRIGQSGIIPAGQQLAYFYAHAGLKTELQILVLNPTDGTIVDGTVNLSTGAVTETDANVTATDAGGGWWKIAGWDTATDVGEIQIYLSDSGSSTYQDDGTGTIYVCAPQAEHGVTSSRTYWPTEDNAYRAADELKWPLSGNFDQDKGTVVLGWVPMFDWGSVDQANDFSIVSATTSQYSLLYFGGDGGGDLAIKTYDGTGHSTLPNLNWDAESPIIVALRWWSSSTYQPSDDANPTGLQIGYSADGGATWTWATRVAYDGAFTVGSYINLAYGITYPGLFSDLHIFDEALTEAQIEDGITFGNSRIQIVG